MQKRLFPLLVFTSALLLSVSILLVCSPQMIHASSATGMQTRTATATISEILETKTAINTPTAVLTVQGTPPSIAAQSAMLLDADTNHILYDQNGEKPMPMASTTKIMMALIAIQSADLEQMVPVKQDAYNRVHQDEGSSANLVVGDKIALKDLLYGLLLPSGDDAAIAIADALGGTNVFVERMNHFAYRYHLFHTHYKTVDGLTITNDETDNHYSTAYDLITLSTYAMKLPLFAQIVQTPHYSLAANAQHHSYSWQTTNNLLTTYKGMAGIKTGHTDAAGWCLVFAATRNGHHLVGVVLNSPTDSQRFQDSATLLNWGFALPVLPPAY